MMQQVYKVDMAKVKAHDSVPPYLRMVREQIKNGDGLVSIWESRGGFAAVYAAGSYAYLLGCPWVPLEALTLAGEVEQEGVSYA